MKDAAHHGEVSRTALLRRRVRRLRAQNRELQLRREEAEQALQAIRSGEVESLVIDGPQGPRIFSLEGATHSYRVLVEEMNEGAATLAEDGTILFCNACFARLLGVALERIVGRPLEEQLAERSRAAFRRLLQGARESDVREEMVLLAADAREIPVYVALSTLVDEGRRLFCLVATDLRAQRKSEALAEAERAARASEARLQLLSRTAGRLLSAEDPQNVLEELCRAVMAHLDCQVFFNFLLDGAGDGSLRLRAWSGIPEEEARKIASLGLGVGVCGAVAQDRSPVVAEDILRSRDERAALVRSYGVQAYCCHPLIAGGELLGTLSFGTRTRTRFTGDEVDLMRTVTDQVAIAIQRLHVQTALSLANAQLREADRRKNDFLAMLSHELRNPLSPLLNSVYILERAEPGGDQACRAQMVIERQVRQLSRLVDDLLDVTRITRNKIQLRKEWLDLAEVVRRAVEDNRSAFQQAGVSLELSGAEAPLPVQADQTRMTQVIGNLLQNSAKFTQRGGRTQVSVAADGDQAVVRVVDDGIGMGKDTLSNLFEPFVQAEEGLARSRGGLGLGLALVKSLVELHGGTVSAGSAGRGTGSQFVIRLPLDREAARMAPPPRPPAGPRRRRVLIVEDNLDAAESLRELLEFGEHAVEVAPDAERALATARVFEPEVVLCDIGLPQADGYQLARSFRLDQRLKGAFLVAVTGYASPEDVQRATAAGFDRHLAKPPNPDELARLLAELPARGHPGKS